MKTWSSDHPKARLMASKRADIIAAAKAAFLDTGFEGTSMEAIAKAANVSIMTLYRHAKTKDDLFAAVIASACDPSDEAEQAEMAALLRKPVREVLIGAAMMAQYRLSEGDTVALMRTVIAEATRFPSLAEMAYRSLLGQLTELVEFVLGAKAETRGLGTEATHRLAAAFIDQLVGTAMLRVLMGLPGLSAEEERQRAEAAADTLLEGLSRTEAARA